MMNRYKKGELVLVNGRGKINNQNNENVVGIVKEKDYYFNQYFIEIPFGEDDWFKEKDLTRLYEKDKKKTKKYKVCLAIKKEGFEYIKNKMLNEEEKTIDLFRQTDLFQEYHVNESVYYYMIWNDTYWPENNFTVRAIEESLSLLRKNDIPYQYIKVCIANSKEKDFEMKEFIKNDSNVDIFEIITNIKLKKIGGII